MMKECVLDASVGVKWFLKEEFSDKADYFLNRMEAGGMRIIVPEFFFLEIANVCHQKVRRKSLSSVRAIEELDKVMELSLECCPDKEFTDVALENAFFYDITVYDSLYVTLAETYLAPLVTADEKLVTACRSKGFDFIESLAEIKLPKI